MNRGSGRLQVFFEDPFWVGVFERVDDGRLSACKVTFGAEPKDYEVQLFLIEHYEQLKFSPAIDAGSLEVRRKNPKRLQREVKKMLQETGIGTKSQIALKLQQEEGKLARHKRSKEEREREKDRQFEQKQSKKKEKHKGR